MEVEAGVMLLRRKQPEGSAMRVLLLALAYAAVHSFFASRPAKRLATRIVGERYRNGLYRPFFILQSIVTTVWAARLFIQLPDREIYRARPPWSYLLGTVQVAGLGLLASAVTIVGVHRLTGLEQAVALLRGRETIPEPEAQGPPPTADGQVDARGPFRFIRHPDNLSIILAFCAFPRMTVNRLTLAVISSVYAVLGSWHEDWRLRTAYGAAFEEYCRSVPMMIPGLRKLLGRRSERRDLMERRQAARLPCS